MTGVLEVRDLRVWYPVRKGVLARTSGYVKAVDGVSFVLARGETLGVVGESGSGKSTIARVLAGLVNPTSGEVRFGDGEKVGMIFQDPLGSLNPRMTVREMLQEALPRDRRDRSSSVALLEMVGLGDSALDRYPHEFSGGQRQRLCIARAIAAEPDVLICDEAVSALDLSIRSQILELLSVLRERLHLSLIFITHDLGVVRHFADRLIVLEKGRIVEEGSCENVLSSPKAAYTRQLLDAVMKL